MSRNTNVIKLSSPATKEFWEIPVLYQDAHLLALDKPAGLPASPDRSDPERPNLMALLHKAIEERKPWTQERQINYLANAHRLDLETSGVMLMARDKPTLVALANLFGSEKPLKEYLVIVAGTPQQPQFEIEAKLGPHPSRDGVMRVDHKNGKRSRTLVQLEESFGGWSLLRVRPLTERTHQIRVHLRYVGLPVVGDAEYGGKPLLLSRIKGAYRLKPGRSERPLLERVTLHAHKLALVHPVTGEPVEITSPLPRDLQVALKYLRRYLGSCPPQAQAEIDTDAAETDAPGEPGDESES